LCLHAREQANVVGGNAGTGPCAELVEALVELSGPRRDHTADGHRRTLDEPCGSLLVARRLLAAH